MLSLEEALILVDKAVQPERLNDLQELVFRKCWAGMTYQEIAEQYDYDADYIRVVGARLWQSLSVALAKKITKSNFHSTLEQYVREKYNQQPVSMAINSFQPEFPDGSVSLNSQFYIDRPPVEERAYREILKPGALLRIKAPAQMGKTSLTLRILAQGKANNYRTVRLNFQQADSSLLTNLDKLLRWFCANIAQQLQQPSLLDDYWDEELGSKVSCTTYLQSQLEFSQSPLIIALDEVNRVFEYPEIAREFLPLLRFWHEEANNLEIWQKLRLLVVHSTEIYIPLNLQQSPFNVGVPIQLPEFTLEQVQTLAERHGLDWAMGESGKQQLKPLLAMIGGHPYLVRLALYHLWHEDLTLEQLLQEAPTQTGIYHHHLQKHLINLQENSELATAFKQVISSQQPIQLPPIVAYKLASMGLVKLQGNKVMPSCQLYCLYFHDYAKQIGDE